MGEGSIEKSTTEDVDWVNNWKKYFKSFTVGEFFIKPTWEEVDEEALLLEQVSMTQHSFVLSNLWNMSRMVTRFLI